MTNLIDMTIYDDILIDEQFYLFTQKSRVIRNKMFVLFYIIEKRSYVIRVSFTRFYREKRNFPRTRVISTRL